MTEETNNSTEMEHGNTEGRTFTQEEVNQIVSNRLKEEREKAKKEQDAGFSEREKKIAARELRLDAIEMLQENGLPISLVDAMNFTDSETMKKSVEIFQQTYKSEPTAPRSTGYEPVAGNCPKPDSIRSAMGL